MCTVGEKDSTGRPARDGPSGREEEEDGVGNGQGDRSLVDVHFLFGFEGLVNFQI